MENSEKDKQDKPPQEFEKVVDKLLKTPPKPHEEKKGDVKDSKKS